MSDLLWKDLFSTDTYHYMLEPWFLFVRTKPRVRSAFTVAFRAFVSFNQGRIDVLWGPWLKLRKGPFLTTRHYTVLPTLGVGGPGCGPVIPPYLATAFNFVSQEVTSECNWYFSRLLICLCINSERNYLMFKNMVLQVVNNETLSCPKEIIL